MSGQLIFIVTLLTISVSVVIVKWRKYNVQKALKMPTWVQPDMNDAFEAARQVGNFLFYRADAAGRYLGMIDKYTGVPWRDLDDIQDGKNRGVIYLMRIAHELGCEVIIRQVTDHNTENPDTTPEKFKELISRLNDNRTN